jgi:hypothetical protein
MVILSFIFDEIVATNLPSVSFPIRLSAPMKFNRLKFSSDCMIPNILEAVSNKLPENQIDSLLLDLKKPPDDNKYNA